MSGNRIVGIRLFVDHSVNGEAVASVTDSMNILLEGVAQDWRFTSLQYWKIPEYQELYWVSEVSVGEVNLEEEFGRICALFPVNWLRLGEPRNLGAIWNRNLDAIWNKENDVLLAPEVKWAHINVYCAPPKDS